MSLAYLNSALDFHVGIVKEPKLNSCFCLQKLEKYILGQNRTAWVLGILEMRTLKQRWITYNRSRHNRLRRHCEIYAVRSQHLTLSAVNYVPSKISSLVTKVSLLALSEQ